jgi:hypothetical protein
MKEQLIEATDRLQTQTKPILAESVFRESEPHQIMLVGGDKISGSPVSFVAVKGVKTWAVFYAYGQRSESHVADNGIKATAIQVQKWMDVEGELMDHYRG